MQASTELQNMQPSIESIELDAHVLNPPLQVASLGERLRRVAPRVAAHLTPRRLTE